MFTLSVQVFTSLDKFCQFCSLTEYTIPKMRLEFYMAKVKECFVITDQLKQTRGIASVADGRVERGGAGITVVVLK